MDRVRRTDPSSVDRAVAAQSTDDDDPARVFARGFLGRVLGGRYRILEPIGEGGMGQVFSAEHTEIGKHVAVKVLQPSCSGRPDLVERFRLEARAASKIGHPNIVDVTDFGTTDEGLVYYVMEQLQGVDLAEVLAQERTVEAARAIQISIQMCQALAAAHQADIIHRDLKPENVFLQPRGPQGDRVKIIDFGLARSLEASMKVNNGRPLTNPGTPIGTPEYMAPEQAEGHPADARSDIYAVGAILYEMITGYPAFSGRGYTDVLMKKTRDKPRPPRELRPDISKELDDVIMWVLERDPARRPQTMSQLEYALTKIARGRGQAVAALLGLEANSETPMPTTSSPPPGVMTPASARGAKKEIALRTLAELEQAGGALMEATDLTVPAATVFAEGYGEADKTMETMETMSSPAPAAVVHNAAASARMVPIASPPPRSMVPPLGVGQAFLERHGVAADGSRSPFSTGKKVGLAVGAALVVTAIMKLLFS